MKIEWKNGGQPLPEGDAHEGELCAVVNLEDGSNPSVFYGADAMAVTNKALEALGNAQSEIKKRRRESVGEPEVNVAPAAPRAIPLTAEERQRATDGLGDPARVVETTRALIERMVGAPLERITEILTPNHVQEMRELAMASAQQFIDLNPEYYPSKANNKKIETYMEMNNWKPNLAAWQRAHDDLAADGLLMAKPAEAAAAAASPAAAAAPATTEPAATTSTRRARGEFASGVREGDVTHEAPRNRNSKYTLRNGVLYEGSRVIPSAEYRERMTDSNFVKAVEQAFADAGAAAS